MREDQHVVDIELDFLKKKVCLCSMALVFNFLQKIDLTKYKILEFLGQIYLTFLFKLLQAVNQSSKWQKVLEMGPMNDHYPNTP